MEITPEIYAWLVNLNVLDGTKSIKMKKEGTILLTEKLTQQMIDGLVFENILRTLEVQYNKFYRLDLNYSKQLDNIHKEIKTSSMRYQNWTIISDVLNNFGIDVTKEEISSLAMGNKNQIINLLNNIYSLSYELNRRSMDRSSTIDPSSSLRKSNNDAGKTNSIDISQFNTNRQLNNSETALEFFILSLVKSLDIKPKQAMALLANNRKYLLHTCNKGIKGDYERILDWFQQISLNSRFLSHLLRYTRDNSKYMAYGVISTGLYSKNYHVAALSYNILMQINADIGPDWEWFVREGIESIIFCIIKHRDLRIGLLNFMYDFNKHNYLQLYAIIKEKYLARIEKLMDFFGAIVNYLPKCYEIVFNETKKFLIEICLKETYFKPLSISILSDAWLSFNLNEEIIFNDILNYIKRALREQINNKITKFVSISQLFRLLYNLGQKKEKFAPVLYKTLVFVFLENYDKSIVREEFLNQFKFLFKAEKTIPIDIMFEPYLRQICTTSNFDTNDFTFLIEMLDHPKINNIEIISKILDFVFFVCLNGKTVQYYTLAIYLFNILFEKNYLKEEFYPKIAEFIKISLKTYIQHHQNTMLLELPYEICNLKIDNIYKLIETEAINTVKLYRNKFKFLSSGLLAILWFSDKHDDVLLQLEEENRPDYKLLDQNESIEQKKRIDPDNTIKKIKDKRRNEYITKKQEERDELIRQKKVQDVLKQQREKRSIELGITNSYTNNTVLESKSLIMKEGSSLSLIKPRINSGNRGRLSGLCIPVDLEEEEPRERKAIETLRKEFKRNIKFYFNKYLTETNNTVTKAQILKMYRDLGFGNNDLSLEDLSLSVRQIFGLPLNFFNFEEFNTLITQLSFFIFYKHSTMLSFSESFKYFLSLLKIPLIRKVDHRLFKSLEEIFYRNNGEILLPPGINKIIKTSLTYKYNIPQCLNSVLSEGQVIVLEILNEIFMKTFNSPILESFIDIQEEIEFKIDINLPKWRDSIILAYTELPKEFNDVAVECSNCLEELLDAVETNRTSIVKEKKPHFKELVEKEEFEKFVEEEKIKRKMRIQRNKKLKEMIENEKEKKKLEKTKKEEEIQKIKQQQQEKLKVQLLKERKIREEMKKEIELQKKKKEEETQLKEKEEKEKENLLKLKKNEQKQKFFKQQKRKLKDQFKIIKTQHSDYVTKQKESILVKLPNVDIKKKLEKDKNFIEFEKNLNQIMFELSERNDIKEIINPFEPHLKTIYDIYSKIGTTKIAFYFEQGIHLNEFKEFCLNYTILPLLINKDQMTYIFRKVSLRNEGEGKGEDKFRLKYEDFIITLVYIVVMSRFGNRARKILPKDVEKIDFNDFKTFFEFMRLKLPFNKKEVEEFINDRRALSVKQLFMLQKNLKKDVVKSVLKDKMKEEVKKNSNSNNEKQIKKEAGSLKKENEKEKENIKVLSPDGKEENWNIEK